MGRAQIIGMAGLAELAAHFLSVTWGFGVLVAGFVMVAGLLRTTSVTAMDTRKRVDALVPAVGAIKDTATAAQATANNALPKAGGTVTGDLGVNGTHTAEYLVANQSVTAWSNLGVHGDVSVPTGTFSLQGSVMPQGGPSDAGAPPNGTGGTSQYAGNFYTGSGAHNWAVALTNAHNNLLDTLRNAGVLS